MAWAQNVAGDDLATAEQFYGGYPGGFGGKFIKTFKILKKNPFFSDFFCNRIYLNTEFTNID